MLPISHHGSKSIRPLRDRNSAAGAATNRNHQRRMSGSSSGGAGGGIPSPSGPSSGTLPRTSSGSVTASAPAGAAAATAASPSIGGTRSGGGSPGGGSNQGSGRSNEGVRNTVGGMSALRSQTDMTHHHYSHMRDPATDGVIHQRAPLKSSVTAGNPTASAAPGSVGTAHASVARHEQQQQHPNNSPSHHPNLHQQSQMLGRPRGGGGGGGGGHLGDGMVSDGSHTGMAYPTPGRGPPVMMMGAAAAGASQGMYRPYVGAGVGAGAYELECFFGSSACG